MSAPGSTTRETRPPRDAQGPGTVSDTGSTGLTIGAVAELTGVPAPTLRAWERRYGIPSPARSASGHRLYHADHVALVRRLRRLVDAGVAPRMAVERLRNAPPAPRHPPAPPDDDPYAVVVGRIVDAIDRFDPDTLESELRRVLVLGSTTAIYERVMVPVMRLLGERWSHDDPLSIAQEHLTTEVMRNVAQDLHRLARPESPLGSAVVACVADEQHVLPLYAIAFRLAQRRIRAVVLGARTPPPVVAVAVERLRPDMVALSATVRPADPEALLSAYGHSCGSTPWIIGGTGLRGWAEQVRAHGGHAIGPDLHLDAFVDGLALTG